MTGVLSEFQPQPATAPAPPAADEVDVWRIPLDPPDDAVAELRKLLSADELARADRFRFERHRRRFTVARGALRRLLGGYLRRPAESIRFAYGEREKPRLADAPPPSGSDPAGLEFNLSHSSELALLAATPATVLGEVGIAKAGIGVDLEAIRPLEDALTIAERFFSAAEREALAAVPETEREEAFFRCWTRKEAYVKAVGDGIALGLARFDVSLEPGAGARFLALEGDPERAAGWSLIHVDPGPGYVGALALPAHPRQVRGWQWRP